MRINDINEDPNILPFEEHAQCRPGYVGAGVGGEREANPSQPPVSTSAPRASDAIPSAALQVLRQASETPNAPSDTNTSTAAGDSGRYRNENGMEGVRGNTAWRISTSVCSECERRG